MEVKNMPSTPSQRNLSPESQHRSPSRKRKRKKKKQKDVFNIPGVHRILLTELAQKIIGCVAGVNVTAENPWSYVSKELIQDNLELHEESSEFLPLRRQIMLFSRPQVLMGFIPGESTEVDEFYICLTEEATDKVTEIIEKMKKEQEERLFNTIHKSIKEWIPQGSEAEVDESIVKNNRPLIEVEVETKYPIFPSKIQFRIARAEHRRDGYMELKPTEELPVNVHKRRIDSYVQVSNQFISTEAQTTCTYPTNSATQYTYEVEDNEALLEKCKKNIIEYANENIENLSDLLRVNGSIDLYSDDYSSLLRDPSAKWTKAAATEEVKEYMYFMDVDMCKGKMIADAVWHPMWTGTVAIAYCDAAPNISYSGQNMEDDVLKAVHGINPVLIWSCLDALKPKLILETPREVHKLSFCDFDENILIGGCKNGQIIIWDIRNKLNKVEELEVLTSAQQKYRAYMHSLMGWMKNIHDLALVRPTAISDLRFSHKGPVTGIIWLSPYYEFSKIGNLMEIPEDWENFSMQFLTSSEDGNILIWDLLKKPIIQSGGYKVKKMRRLRKRPSALMVDVSPYRALHLTLKPIYKVKARKTESSKMNLPIANCSANYCKMNYVEVNSDKTKKTHMSDRILYKPVFQRDSDQGGPEPRLHVGSMEGDYAFLKWDGQDFDSGEIVNSESCQLLSFAKYHDGPLNSVHTSDVSNVTLTVGGKIFAIWREDLKDRPILWRRNKNIYTSGKWNIFQPYSFTNQLKTGEVENWNVFNNSKMPIYTLTCSSSFLTVSAMHPIKLKKDIYGAGDIQGSFRLFFLPEDPDSTMTSLEWKNKAFCEFIDSEIKRKKAFLSWQEEWNQKNAAWIKQKEDEQKEIMEKEEKARKAKEAEQREEKAAEKAIRKGPQPGKYIEWIKEQRQLEEEARIKSTIISKKQLDTKELEKRRKPLQKLDEENERKKRKQKQRLKEGETIFRDTVAMLFPDVVKEKPAPPPDPYAGGEPINEVERTYYQYIEIVREAEEFIETSSFHYEFNWKEVLAGGKNRRDFLNSSLTSAHKRRYEMQKNERQKALPKVESQEKTSKIEVETVGIEEGIGDDEDKIEESSND